MSRGAAVGARAGTRPLLLQHCTWPEVEAYLERSRGIVVPAGATEQHGPTGLIGTDWICAEAIAAGVSQRTGALVAPALSLGVAPFNLVFPGTISLRPTTLMSVIVDCVRSLARQGFERFFVVNGHGGNVAPIRAAFHEVESETGADDRLRFRLRSWWELPAADALRKELFGAWEGMHATPSEISIVQHLLPGENRDVPMAPPVAVSAAYMRDHAGDQHGPAEEHRRKFPDGRVGSDPSLATAAAGARLLEAAVTDAAAEYEAFLTEP